MELKTPLYGAHVKAGGKIVPFAGYLLPVQYGTGVITCVSYGRGIVPGKRCTCKPAEAADK